MSRASLKVLIVDDEPIARARLRVLCAGMADWVEVTGEAADGADALARISADSPDVVLLDIAMPDLDGVEVADMLARTGAPPAVIFCTANPAHALWAFEVSAVDYLLKPVARDRLERAFAKAAVLRAGPAVAPPPATSWLDHLWVPHREAMKRIEMADVEQIVAEGDYVRLVTPRASHLLHETMTRLESRLDPNRFVRVRRSVIVRVDLLRTVTHLGGGSWNVVLADGTAVRAGPNYWKALKERLASRSPPIVMEAAR